MGVTFEWSNINSQIQLLCPQCLFSCIKYLKHNSQYTQSGNSSAFWLDSSHLYSAHTCYTQACSCLTMSYKELVVVEVSSRRWVGVLAWQTRWHPLCFSLNRVLLKMAQIKSTGWQDRKWLGLDWAWVQCVDILFPLPASSKVLHRKEVTTENWL